MQKKSFCAVISSACLLGLLLLLDTASLLELAVGGICWVRAGTRGQSCGGLNGADSVGEVGDVDVAAFRTQLVERLLEAEEVVNVETTRAAALVDVLGQLLGILGSDELVVVRRADVDEGADGFGAVGRVEGGIVNAVAVDLPDVEVVLDFGDLVSLDAVGDAPYTIRGRVVMVSQLFPVGTLDQCRDATRGFRCTPVVLASDGQDDISQHEGSFPRRASGCVGDYLACVRG